MKKGIKITIVLICLLLALALAVVPSRVWILVEAYEISTAGKAAGIQIALISDLHGQAFGEGNERLVRKLAEQAPDLICVAGDMFEADASEDGIADFAALLRELVEIAPVFVSCGNTEMAYEVASGAQWRQIVENTGATLLEEDYVDLEINGRTLRVGGLFGYAFRNAQNEDAWKASETYRFLSDFTQTDAYKILLCHRPDSFIFNEAYNGWQVDLVLCGHTHGGLCRLPLVGGLYAPEQGWLPKYDKGLFALGNINMVITSGLSGYGWIPRVLNLPELTMIRLGE
ncbi:MAG: metallophosphoesterase [Faecousia sp.]